MAELLTGARASRGRKYHVGVMAVCLSAAVIGVMAFLPYLRSWWARSAAEEGRDASSVTDAVVAGAPVAKPESVARAGVPLPGTASSISAEPETLRLVSTNPGGTPRSGTARLGTHAANPQTYVAGALLVNGARLLEIHGDHVVLERHGRQASLYLAGRGNRGDSQLLEVGGTPARTTPVAANHSEVLASYLRPTPVYEGEVLKGYQVYPGPRSAVFWQMGLRSGDVILSLNGQPFSDPSQAVESLRQLTTSTAAVATIERAGKVENVNLDASLIMQDQQQLPLP